MGLFDRLFGKKKDTKEQIEEQEIAQVLEETSADESKEVAETAAVETQAEDVIESEVTPVSEEARQLDETKEAAEADFLGVMADYYAKKEAAKEALDRGETVEFEAVETKQEDVKEESVEPVNAPVETEEEKYNRSLKKTRTGFSARLNAFLANFRRVDEDFFEELEEMLILSDVGVNVATQLTEDLRYEAKLENAKKADDLKRVIIEKLVEIYEKDGVFNEQINFQNGLTVMLFVGVNGVGKTTSIGKLAYKYKNEGKKVMLVAADTFRAGAVAQLAEWGRRVDVPVVTGPEKADPASVVFDGMERAVAENVDVLLIDTAGRLQNKDNLMAELEKIGRIIKRVVPDAPHETLLALDASTGQNALSQAKEFSKITPLTGLILTKIDGTAKGGVVLAIRQELDIPVKFIGFGEKIDDIGEFDSEDFIRGLLEGII
ncbi:signal recognition particle-docking protein [Streptococcus infantarius subsp. infantarius]|uniref:signal recognition particle-docking protein FtsY n=1 Tax=uncultured Streptococcus sp. TaxID=83427 RepID=UPI00024DCDDD|nr:signal recognition particle-docking protein FtsY [uncultured Streptococcus sp.]AEZ62705.1 signal recognition particle-docking protein [Streptococcus infantarius subsp. infantarius CJ18]MCO4529262.1 signal recognition particle-docking protein [Streptococcus infantarius subsp. infantarius]MCO4639725.1 signal recognition particle-docking protein [Streptococcus infantarius subsp. infantarius]MCO4647141.1 signal recognition particle-docking protein [Streptococcus infantarius subsp. infantarius]M